MTVNSTEISNLALSLVTLEGINSYEEDMTKRGATVRLWLPFCRKSILTSFNFNFAVKYLKVAVWNDAITRPEDCVKILSINDGNILYRLSGEEIILSYAVPSSNSAMSSSVTLAYIYDNKDYNTWSHQVIELLAYKLAIKLAHALKPDKELVQLLTLQETKIASVVTSALAQEENRSNIRMNPFSSPLNYKKYTI